MIHHQGPHTHHVNDGHMDTAHNQYASIILYAVSIVPVHNWTQCAIAIDLAEKLRKYLETRDCTLSRKKKRKKIASKKHSGCVLAL